MSPERSLRAAHAVLLALLVFLGCSPAPGTSLATRYTPLSRQPTDARPRTGGVLVVADNQIHHLYGEPTFFRTHVTDAWISKTAIRPPQLDLFGQDWFAQTLEARSNQVEAVVHLGDALDFACDTEWRQFLKVMRSAHVPWALAPGNHDAYFFGNFEVASHVTRGTRLTPGMIKRFWRESCKGGGEPLRKNRFVTNYLEALRTQASALPLRSDQISQSGSVRCQSAECSKHFVQEVVWNVDREQPWRSFVVQRVNLGYCHRSSLCTEAIAPLYAILLDTSTYRQPAGLTADALELAAGARGALGPDQRASVQRMLEEAGDAPTLLMGHHPFDELDPTDQAFIDEAIRQGSMLYVSAHTHQGGYYVHGTGNDGWLELNVGSVLDYPPQYTLLSFLESGSKPVLKVQRKLMIEELTEQGTCADKTDWEPLPRDADFFVSYARLGGRSAYRAGATQHRLFNTLLHAMRRFYRCVPRSGGSASPSTSGAPNLEGTCSPSSPEDARIAQALSAPLDEKAKVLGALAQDMNDPSRFEAHTWRNYRKCQAFWAAKYERFEARVPDKQDEYFMVSP